MQFEQHCQRLGKTIGLNNIATLSSQLQQCGDSDLLNLAVNSCFLCFKGLQRSQPSSLFQLACFSSLLLVAGGEHLVSLSCNCFHTSLFLAPKQWHEQADGKGTLQVRSETTLREVYQGDFNALGPSIRNRVRVSSLWGL